MICCELAVWEVSVYYRWNGYFIGSTLNPSKWSKYSSCYNFQYFTNNKPNRRVRESILWRVGLECRCSNRNKTGIWLVPCKIRVIGSKFVLSRFERVVLCVRSCSCFVQPISVQQQYYYITATPPRRLWSIILGLALSVPTILWEGVVAPYLSAALNQGFF